MPDLFASLEPLGPKTLGKLGNEQTAAFVATLEALQKQQAASRVWGREGSLWAGDDSAVALDVEDRLGWLDLPRDMRLDVPRLRALAAEARAAGITRVVLLGMGGSSLAPEVMAAVLPAETEGCELIVLDSTDPAQIRRIEEGGPLAQALFIAASKSGTTAETDSLYAYFRARLIAEVGEDNWSAHFVAITDPGTVLSRRAAKEQFRATYINPPDIGGRYSALSFFGLVPAALAGIDLDRLLLSAQEMAWACRATIPDADNPAVVLGAVMGACAQVEGLPIDKLTLITSPGVAAFGPWAEQLIAESTGKHGVGILPVEGEPLAAETPLSADRLFVYLRLQDDDNAQSDELAERVLAQELPLLVLTMPEPYALGAEFFRWEFATAIAGQVLGINPFDQPDVESAKKRARGAIADYEQTHTLRQLPILLAENSLGLSGPERDAQGIADYLRGLFAGVQPGRYVAVMAYIERSQANEALLQTLRSTLLDGLGVPVTLGFGPRFLHSTGQLHKGGPNEGLFIQIVQQEADDLDIPERGYSFGVLKASQALGDWEALQEAGRLVVRLNVGSDVAAGLEKVQSVIKAALAAAGGA